jgi:small GTP-binding protein
MALRRVKVICLGNTGTGKTCLLNRIVNGTWDDGLRPTINVEQHTLDWESPDGHSYVANFWDTAGQEAYHAVVRSYYRDVHIALLCYSTIETTSLPSLKNWKTNLQNESPQAHLVVVATKSDAEGKERVGDRSGLDKAQDWGGSFVSTSAKTGAGIDSLVEEIKKLSADVVDPSESGPVPATGGNCC